MKCENTSLNIREILPLVIAKNNRTNLTTLNINNARIPYSLFNKFFILLNKFIFFVSTYYNKRNMSAYCSIEESCNVLLPNGGGLSDGMAPIRSRKPSHNNKKRTNKDKVPTPYHFNANQSYCSFGIEDDNNQVMSGLVNPVPTNPSYYNENVIDDEYRTQQQLGKYTGHQPREYSEFKADDIKETHSDVSPNNSNNTSSRNNNNNNNKALSDILKRLDRLETRMNQMQSPKGKSNIHDIILYIIIGVFILFILDSMFKIGKLTSN